MRATVHPHSCPRRARPKRASAWACCSGPAMRACPNGWDTTMSRAYACSACTGSHRGCACAARACTAAGGLGRAGSAGSFCTCTRCGPARRSTGVGRAPACRRLGHTHGSRSRCAAGDVVARWAGVCGHAELPPCGRSARVATRGFARVRRGHAHGSWTRCCRGASWRGDYTRRGRAATGGPRRAST